MNEDIYISINTSNVDDWEHDVPDVELSVIVVGKTVFEEEKYVVGNIVDLLVYLEV